MTDLSQIKNEDVSKRLDEVPERVRLALASDELDQKLIEIAEKYEFVADLDEGSIIEQLIVLLATGIIKRDEFAEQIEFFTYQTASEAQDIANEILKILGPVLPTSAFGTTTIKPDFIKPSPTVPPANPTFAPPRPTQMPTPAPVRQPAPQPVAPVRPVTPTPAPITIKPAEITNPIKIPNPIRASEPIKPAPTAPVSSAVPQGFASVSENPIRIWKSEPAPAAPAPFMIHEQNEITPQASSSYEPSRPTFIKPQFTAPSSPLSNPANPSQGPANIDFGKGLYDFRKNYAPSAPPKASEQVKRVDYSTFKVSPTPAQKTSPKSPEGINPDNVIDLKDLPK